MSPLALSPVASAATNGFANAIIVSGVILVGIVVVLFVLAIALLFRRREGAKPSAAAGIESIRARAGVALVTADNAVADASDELGFAVAQFGTERTAEFAQTLDKARAQLAAAFRLQHQLDDAFTESLPRQREWLLQIVALADSVVESLARHDRSFVELRGAEAEAPERTHEVRRDILAESSRIADAAAQLADLRERFDPRLTASLETAVDDAKRLLDEADLEIAAAEAGPAAERLQRAQTLVHRARLRLSAIGERGAELDTAAKALDARHSAARHDLAEARDERERAPGADEADAITAGISALESAVATSTPSDPLESLDRIDEASAQLDAALATARSQAQRIEHARTALEATLASATAQLSEVRAFVHVGGNRVSADARARLSEAERELAFATGAGIDPVEALDASRRAITLVRDADAIARYNAMNGPR